MLNKLGNERYMGFDEALKLLVKGIDVKLPTWSGFWRWNPETETIDMHCKEGTIIDIRNTDRLQYTLENICSKKWIVSTEHNTGLKGGLPTFDAEDALDQLKKGQVIMAKGRSYITYRLQEVKGMADMVVLEAKANDTPIYLPLESFGFSPALEYMYAVLTAC